MNPERQRELHAAALAALAEAGYDNLSMDDVAVRAKASKATLYRHWADKEALVVDALRCHHDAAAVADAPDTGTLRGDLHALITEDVARDQAEADLITAVLHACRANPTLADQLRAHVLAQHQEVLDALIARAVARGEIPADPPAARFALTVLAAPRLLRAIVEGEPVDAEYERAYVDAVILPALGAS